MPDYSTFFNNIAITDVQQWLNDFTKLEGLDSLRVDGVVGRKTWRAVRAYLSYIDDLPKDYEAAWSNARKAVCIEQAFLNDKLSASLKLDGLFGPNTRYAVELWQDFARDLPTPLAHEDSPWPSENEVEEFYGKIGKNHTSLTLPYPMRIAWDPNHVISNFTINKKCAASAGRILTKVHDHYGFSRIQELGLDLFAGCYNPRPKRGGREGNWSMHAYACAIDFDSAHNQFRWTRTQARFARPEYDAWWSFWEEEGWVSLGRARNYDWMHIQAATI